MDGITGGDHDPTSVTQVWKDGFFHFHPGGSARCFHRQIFVTCELRSALPVINFRQFQ